jgi:putative membrane protein
LKRVALSGIESHIARVEAATGVQIVVALINKADTYLELPWRAFALGASMGAFATVVTDAWSTTWLTFGTLLTAAVTLGAGAALAIAAMLAPPFARLFLRDIRRNAEVRQYAESMFLRRELFATRERNAVLVLVARFERKVEIRPDVGLHDRVTSAEWSRVIAKMAPALSDERYADAFRDGLEAIEALLVGKGVVRSADATNEVSNRPIIEKGARE